MLKDFLFFNYSWVPNSTFLFKSIEKMGYSCDFVDENTIFNYIPEHNYKIVVVYLHEDNMLPKINYLIDNYFTSSILVQHDDTDSEQINYWTRRKPNFIMQRELTKNTNNPYNCIIYPFHFPIQSMYISNVEKTTDVVYYSTLTNYRRIPFIKKVIELSQTTLKHLKWDLRITDSGVRTPEDYKLAINKAKIGLHYFGNSYDAWRIWEYASCGLATLMPELRMNSITKEFIEFNKSNYVILKDDFSDLHEKILFTLNNYEYYSKKIIEEYNYHTPDKCFEKYFSHFKPFV